MDTSKNHGLDQVEAASKEIERILEKYDLCGFFSITSKNHGLVRFSFRDWSGMKWGIGEDGYPFTQVKILMNDDVGQAMELVENALLVTGYFQEELFHQSENMQTIIDDMNKCFNVGRNDFGKKLGNLH